jgi:hypothetical protein|tara:strand:- start:72877 stop:73152 length:276 start_codon:yes stop_codon:yes gene_type:complete
VRGPQDNELPSLGSRQASLGKRNAGAGIGASSFGYFWRNKSTATMAAAMLAYFYELSVQSNNKINTVAVFLNCRKKKGTLSALFLESKLAI